MVFRPTPKQLEYLVAVVETGHFGKAADMCNVAQPTLSVQLKLLEDRLGVQLIERGMKRALATPAGLRLLPYARLVLNTLDDMRAAADISSNNLGGLIRLGAAPTFGPYILPGILPRLHEQYQDLEIYIREDRPVELEADLVNGKLDCVITPAPILSENLKSEMICEETIFLGIPIEDPIAQFTKINVEDLNGRMMLTMGSGHRLYENVRSLCDRSGAIMREDYEGTSLDAVRQMVSIGMGISLFPAAYISSEFEKAEGVVLRQIEGNPMTRMLALAWRKNSPREASFKILLEELRDACKRFSPEKGLKSF